MTSIRNEKGTPTGLATVWRYVVPPPPRNDNRPAGGGDGEASLKNDAVLRLTEAVVASCELRRAALLMAANIGAEHGNRK